MSETEAKAQGQKPKISKLAIASLVFGLLGPLSYLAIKIISSRSDIYLMSSWLGAIGLFSLGFAWIPGLLFGAASIGLIKHRRGRLTGKKYANTGLLISTVWVIFIFGCFGRDPAEKARIRLAKRIRCATNLHGLGIALQIYADDYDDQYPAAEKWCDALIEYGDSQYVSEKLFVCRSAGEGRCHYAMNPNLSPRSHPRLVLLFETKGGWNQVGGPEILTTENHKGKGCNVLFNDYHVEFVKTERLGELKWEVEEGEK